MDEKIIFLHIPKTAGQSIHSELVRVYGSNTISPIRTHTQGASFVNGNDYKVFSGHIDWDDIDKIGQNRIVFTVLRDPLERMASFYFYLLEKAKLCTAEELKDPSKYGLLRILSDSIEDYFFPKEDSFRIFIEKHYENFYTYYFATRKIADRSSVKGLSADDIMKKAQENLNGVFVSSIKDLGKLEEFLKSKTGNAFNFVSTKTNVGPKLNGNKVEVFKSMFPPKYWNKVLKYAEQDYKLIDSLGIEV